MGNDVLPREVAELLPYLTETERQELDGLLRDLPLWLPLPGPQLAAYTTQADIIGFGGAAGGGAGCFGVRTSGVGSSFSTIGSLKSRLRLFSST